MSDNFYKAFEDRYRGGRELITGRLSAYLPFITPLAGLYQPARALDVGCGRGEWLELAGAAGFAAHGVDLDDGMLSACRERGLSVETADAIATLRAMDDNSLAMVSAFHVVEHIPFDAVRTLVAEALRVLQPGGVLIMETPNPENLVVGANSFYRDPSHVRPLPPELLAFATEHAGFRRNKVVRLQEPAELHGNMPLGVQHVLDGVSPDYSVVAQKGAAADVLARFDAAFTTDFGVSFAQAAQRYDQQAAEQRGLLDMATAYGEQSRAQLDAMHANVQQLGANAEHAHSDLDARMRQLEERMAEAEARLATVYFSYSWRIIAPLWWIERAARRVVRARRNGRIVPGLRQRARAAVRIAAQAVLRNAGAKRVARTVLARLPGLRSWLREMMYQGAADSGLPPAPLASDLSPRAERIYAKLKQPQQKKED